MVILCAIEEDKLFQNCFRDSKKIVPGTSERAKNEVHVVKSNFLDTISTSATWLSLLCSSSVEDQNKSQRMITGMKKQRQKGLVSNMAKRDGDYDSQFCQGTYPVFTLVNDAW